MIRVTADIRYIDGTLSGLDIPSGYALTAPDMHHAYRYARWISRVRRENDFVRASVTGNRYQFTSEPRIERSI